VVLFFTALLSCTSAELVTTGATTENLNNLLKATLTSKGKREVSYKKWDGVDVEFNIENISNSNIEINLEYIKKAGLWLSLKNRKLGNCANIWPGLPIEKAVKPFTILHPGEQITIKNKVYHVPISLCLRMQMDNDIYEKTGFPRIFNGIPIIDFDLEVGAAFPMQVNNQSIYVILKDTIRILEIEKPSISN
jgi:hypothetical protein